MVSPKWILGGLVRRLGYEVSRVRPTDASQALPLLLHGVKTVFDCGASVGRTAQLYRSLFPEAKIYCFEPAPDAFRQLAARFTGDPQVVLEQSAVGAAPSTAVFYLNALRSTSSMLPRPREGRRYYPKDGATTKTIDVPVLALDDFARSRSLSAIDLLKIDVQGAELHVLEGAEQLLTEHAVSVIYVEVAFVRHYDDAPLFHHVAAYLEARGYSVFSLYDIQRAVGGQLRYADAIFISPQVRRDIVDRMPPEP